MKKGKKLLLTAAGRPRRALRGALRRVLLRPRRQAALLRRRAVPEKALRQDAAPGHHGAATTWTNTANTSTRRKKKIPHATDMGLGGNVPGFCRGHCYHWGRFPRDCMIYLNQRPEFGLGGIALEGIKGRIKGLNKYQKAVLLILAAMAVVFLALYAVTISRVGFEYNDNILVPERLTAARCTPAASGESRRALR